MEDIFDMIDRVLVEAGYKKIEEGEKVRYEFEDENSGHPRS